ncbi:MAG: calcium-binding protein [Nocardioides sp.]
MTGNLRGSRRALVVVAALAVSSFGMLAPPSQGHAAYTCNGVAATIVGSAGPNEIHGTPGRDVIVGLGGDDDIEGRGGRDVICGNRGHDELEGDRGDDRLYGGPGHDEAEGGPGRDVCVAEETEGC